MRVKFNGKLSTEHVLIGEAHYYLGLIEYLVQSNDAADCVDVNDWFKYIDELSILEILSISGALTKCDCWQTVPPDNGVDQKYLRPESSLGIRASNIWMD